MVKKKKRELGRDKWRREKSFIAKRTQRNKDGIDIDPHLRLQYVFSGMSEVGVKQSYRGDIVPSWSNTVRFDQGHRSHTCNRVF